MTEKQATLPTDPKARKALPIASGVLDYFPDALAVVAECSKKGNDQHNPGQPLHWDRSKSTDHADCIVRHLIDRGTMDSDGIRHSAKVAWRALALLQVELEAAAAKPEILEMPEDPEWRKSMKGQIVAAALERCDNENLSAWTANDMRILRDTVKAAVSGQK